MKSSMSFRNVAKVAAVAILVASAAGAAQARTNVFFSVSAPIAPGVVIGASNGPGYYPQVYSQPVYAQPVYSQPVYSQPYYEPAPVYYDTAYYDTAYYAPSYYVRPAPVVYGGGYYYGRPAYRHHSHVLYTGYYR